MFFIWNSFNFDECVFKKTKRPQKKIKQKSFNLVSLEGKYQLRLTLKYFTEGSEHSNDIKQIPLKLEKL